MHCAWSVQSPEIFPQRPAMIQTYPAPPSEQSAVVLHGSATGSGMVPPESAPPVPPPSVTPIGPSPPLPVLLPVIVPVPPPEPLGSRSRDCLSLEQATSAASAQTTTA